MIRKVMIVPFFGELPPWMDHWYENTERLRDHGYDFLHEDDEDAFRTRVREVLGIEPPLMTGTGNIWDFRPALGYLYRDMIQGFDFWGHTDFDCVYGRVEKWMTDAFLEDLDLYGNHHGYVSGPWSLYRNVPTVNNLFRETDEWGERMTSPVPSGWAEKGFTEIVNVAHNQGLIRRHFETFQTRNWDDFSTLRLAPLSGRLMEGGEEVMMAHFRRTKIYPEGCRR